MERARPFSDLRIQDRGDRFCMDVGVLQYRCRHISGRSKAGSIGLFKCANCNNFNNLLQFLSERNNVSMV